MEYENSHDASSRSDTPNRCSGKDGAVTATWPGSKLFRLVAVSFGLLCVVQAALNMSLRLTLFSKSLDTNDSYINLTEECDNLKRKLISFDQYFQQGWVYFHHSFYHISTISKSWKDSRDDCLRRGADLVVINSKEEQEFTRKFYQYTWIGLTDRETRGMWRWVDGTPMTESYWIPGEPNKYQGKDEDCVQLKSENTGNNWNDVICEEEHFFICEKMMAF